MKWFFSLLQICLLINYSVGQEKNYECPEYELGEIEESDLEEFIEMSTNMSKLLYNAHPASELENFKQFCDEAIELRILISDILDKGKCNYRGQAADKLVLNVFCKMDDEILEKLMVDTLYNRITSCETLLISDCLRPSDELPDYCE